MTPTNDLARRSLLRGYATSLQEELNYLEEHAAQGVLSDDIDLDEMLAEMNRLLGSLKRLNNTWRPTYIWESR